MDARITKSRLSNLLSYDWLKIIISVAVAVLAICVFFTTVQTRPGQHQVFTVYGYRELFAGSSAGSFIERLKSENKLSYDVLKTEQETFGTGQYAETAFTARRSAGQGTVMFTTTNRTDAETDATVLSELLGGEYSEMALDLAQYRTDCEKYLARFFGDEWETGELDKAEAEKCFLARNGSDRRFRSDAKKQEGVQKEYERLEKLRTDYLFVSALMDDGTLPFVEVVGENGESRPRAVALGKLAGLRNFYYYTEETDGKEITSAANVCMFIFRNDADAGKSAYLVTNDLRYETFSFLRALVEQFGA